MICILCFGVHSFPVCEFESGYCDLNRMLGVKSLNVVEEKMARVLVQKISNFSSQILEAVISLTEIDQ